MKIVIKETYGGLKTYLNQVFLFDDIIESNKYTNESGNLLSNPDNKTEEDNIDSENPNAAITETENFTQNDPSPKKIL